MVYAAERMCELINDPEITSTDIRDDPDGEADAWAWAWSRRRAARCFHHYETDDNGLITKANLIVATQNNSARMAMSVEKAAKGLINGGEVNEGLLNKVEMAFRAYDPCHALRHALAAGRRCRWWRACATPPAKWSAS